MWVIARLKSVARAGRLKPALAPPGGHAPGSRGRDITAKLPVRCEPMGKFFDLPPLTDDEYRSLPPLVPKGEDRDAVLNRIVTGWCTPTGKTGVDEHIAAGGLVVERVAFVDGNTGEPIDLDELLQAVEERLRAAGAPERFTSRSDLFILLRGCWIPRCDASNAKVRPRFVTFRLKFEDDVDFESATFGKEASFASATFGVGARFASATFGYGASFALATFGAAADFASATFGDAASFDSAALGFAASFASATFGDNSDFYLATFDDWASFASAIFGKRVRFDSATFGDSADFASARFGDWARFASATIGDRASFLNTRFGSGGGIVQARVAPPLQRKRWLDRRWWWPNLRQKFNWTHVRAFGELHVLTRVSYLALVLVPLVAGVWPAVRRLVNLVDRDLDPLPIGWVLAFLGALAVAIGHLVYQLAAEPLVRRQSSAEFQRERAREYLAADDRQRRDLLTRPFAWLGQIAERMPNFRHRNFVCRHDQTVWIPSDLEELERVQESRQPPPAVQVEPAPTDSGAKAPPAVGAQPPAPKPTAAATAALPFNRHELAQIMIDEGARAEYDVAARQKLGWAGVAAGFYGLGAVFVVWLVAWQLWIVLREAGGWGTLAQLSWFGLVTLLLVAVASLGEFARWRRRRESPTEKAT